MRGGEARRGAGYRRGGAGGEERRGAAREWAASFGGAGSWGHLLARRLPRTQVLGASVGRGRSGPGCGRGVTREGDWAAWEPGRRAGRGPRAAGAGRVGEEEAEEPWTRARGRERGSRERGVPLSALRGRLTSASRAGPSSAVAQQPERPAVRALLPRRMSPMAARLPRQPRRRRRRLRPRPRSRRLPRALPARLRGGGCCSAERGARGRRRVGRPGDQAQVAVPPD